MKYSFVLPAYKAHFLSQAIDSILSQTYTEFELIIVNDASPEDLDSIVESYSDSRIRYYKNQQNIGGRSLVEQWNYCISLCDSEYFVLASDDDIYDSEYLAKIDSLVNKYPECSIFRPRVQIIDSNNDIVAVEGFLKEETTVLEYMYLLGRHYIYGGIPFYLFKRESLMRIGGFIDMPLAWGADDATALSLAKEGGVRYSNEILFSFRMSGENITSRKNDFNALRNKIHARNLYYNFVNNLLQQCSPDKTIDEFYLNFMKQNSQSIIVKSLYELICDSTVFAALKCIRELYKFPYVSLKWLLFSYAKRIGQALLYK